MTPVIKVLHHKKIWELDHLHEVPCIFLGGLSDDVLIKTGTEMGIEGYTTKLVSDQSVIATIKDKIKRDRHIKSRQKARRVALLGALEIPKSLLHPPVHTNRTTGCPNPRGSGRSALSPSRSSTPSSAFAE